MDTNVCNVWLFRAICIGGLITLIGFFATKTRGFGRFATSCLLLLIVAIFTALFLATSRFEAQVVANIFFAVIGFAGGLFTGKDSDDQKNNKNNKNEGNVK